MFDFAEHDLAGLLSNANVKFNLAEIKKVRQDYWDTRQFSPPTGGFFLAPAEGCSLWLHQKGPLDPKVILPDGRTTGLRELDGDHDVLKLQEL